MFGRFKSHKERKLCVSCLVLDDNPVHRARTEAQSLVTNVTGLVDQRCSQLVTEGGRLCSQVTASAN